MAMELDYDYLAKLVERTQMGDSDAFAELYTATYQKQYRFAFSIPRIPIWLRIFFRMFTFWY